MIAELCLALTAATSSVSVARRYQIEAAGWERLAAECAGELRSARGERDWARLQVEQLRARTATAAAPVERSRWPAVVAGAIAGAAVAGGGAASIACEGPRCRGAGLAVGAAALVAAVVMLLSQ